MLYFIGTNQAKWHVENFCMDIWCWFQKSPARQEDFENIMNEINDSIESSMLYFASTRWVLLGKVIERVLSKEHSVLMFFQLCFFSLEQFDVLREYFLIYLPSKQSNILKKNNKYDEIKDILVSNISKVRLHFILFLCRSIFDPFLTWFQKEGPLIHLLYDELSDLYRSILLCFLSREYVGSISGSDLLNVDFKLAEKQLPTKTIHIGKH